MADNKPKYPTYSVRGIARYPRLNAPDTKFKADGEYKVDVRVKTEDAQKLIEKLEAIRDKFFDELEPKVKKVTKKAEVFTVELDDAGNETGFVLFRTKLNATWHSKKTGKSGTNTVALFDAKGRPTSAEPWSGSELIVAGTIEPYHMPSTKMCGVSLKCRGVQIITLVSGGNRDASSFGFKEQDGYETPAAQAGIGNADADNDAPDSEPAEDGNEF